MDSDTLMITRRIAWQRAKGELMSILECYMSSRDGEQSAKDYERMSEGIEKFINWVESESPIA
jgi:hypothetical protein